MGRVDEIKRDVKRGKTGRKEMGRGEEKRRGIGRIKRIGGGKKRGRKQEDRSSDVKWRNGIQR